MKGINDDKKLQINDDSGDEITDALLTECPPPYVVPSKNNNIVPTGTTVAAAEQREIQIERTVQTFQIDALPVDSALTVIPPGVTALNVTDSMKKLQAAYAQTVPRQIVTVQINMGPTQKVQSVAEGVNMSEFFRNSEFTDY